MVEVFTDGACRGNPGPGGWAAIINAPGMEGVEISGGVAHTTNNRMEILAAVESLRFLGKNHDEITVYTDSAYLCNCIKEGWYRKWMANGWKTSKGTPVENQDLWSSLLALIRGIDTPTVHFVKVKGHADNALNNRCDELAVAQSKKY